MITFDCECGKRYRADAEQAGKRMKCIECEQLIRIPGVMTNDAEDAPSHVVDESTFTNEPAFEEEPYTYRESGRSNRGGSMWLLFVAILLMAVLGGGGFAVYHFGFKPDDASKNDGAKVPPNAHILPMPEKLEPGGKLEMKPKAKVDPAPKTKKPAKHILPLPEKKLPLKNIDSKTELPNGDVEPERKSNNNRSRVVEPESSGADASRRLLALRVVGMMERAVSNVKGNGA